MRNDFERLAASLGCLAPRRCEAPADKVGEHFACDSAGAQQRFSRAALIDLAVGKTTSPNELHFV
jgi:hypothetical protein